MTYYWIVSSFIYSNVVIKQSVVFILESDTIVSPFRHVTYAVMSLLLRHWVWIRRAGRARPRGRMALELS